MQDAFVPMAQMVADRISDMIFLEKTYEPNQKLPNEYELSAQLNVSRTSLREAIKILAANGVLTVRRGSGTFVSAVPHGKKEPFGFAYIKNKKKLIEHWFEFRLIYEPPCARLAAQNATMEEIEGIVDSANRIVSFIANDEPYLEEDQLFHTLITQATHNEILLRSLPSIESAVRDTFSWTSMLGFVEKCAKNASDYHPNISYFIAEGDGYGAEMAMRYHILKGVEDLKMENLLRPL